MKEKKNLWFPPLISIKQIKKQKKIKIFNHKKKKLFVLVDVKFHSYNLFLLDSE